MSQAIETFFQDYIFHWEHVLAPWGAMLMMVVAGLYVSLFTPSVRVWYTRQRRRSREKARKIEELLRKAKEKEPSMERCRARIQVAKLAAKNIVAVIIAVALFVGLFWSLNVSNAKRLRSSWSEFVRLHDEAKEGLFFKTIRRSDSKEEAVAIWHQQILCQTQAGLATDRAIGDDITRIRIGKETYFACMWEAGWETARCVEGEDDCVEVPFHDSACLSARRNWLKDERRTYVVENCQSFPPNPFQPSR